MSEFSNDRFNMSDSGVFLLDPKDRALLSACREAMNQDDETEDEAHRRFLKIARELPTVRLQKVMEIRRKIAEGTYITDEKIQGTVDRLLDGLR
jgi:anti-sigma28 factor (negative regulator of flagellin synthesis)